MKPANILPRVLRLRDAPLYLGMDIHRFNQEVRPHVQEFSIGKQGIGFDRLDLDAWFEVYKTRRRRSITSRGKKLWDVNTRQGLLSEKMPGTSIKSSLESEFVKVLEQARSLKRNNICPKESSN
jgi:hypothetical protein